MSAAKFTPGPWRWCRHYLMQDCHAPHGFGDAQGKETNPYNTPCGRPIADDGSAGGDYTPAIDITGPDAALIAAAPEMYEALKDALTQEPDYALILAAIAKAEG